MEAAAQLSFIIPALNATVERIDPDQLGSLTPCDGFTVQEVLDHVLVLGATYSYVFRGEEPPEFERLSTPGRVPVAELRTTMGDLFSSVRSPGAMERTVHAAVGEVTGETWACLVAFDFLGHCRTLAAATEQELELPPEVVEDIESSASALLTRPPSS